MIKSHQIDLYADEKTEYYTPKLISVTIWEKDGLLHDEEEGAAISYDDGFADFYFQEGKIVSTPDHPSLVEDYSMYYYSPKEIEKPILISELLEKSKDEDFTIEKLKEFLLEQYQLSSKNYPCIIRKGRFNVHLTKEEVWFYQDHIHREDGPAIIYYNRDQTVKKSEWYIEGVLIESEDKK